MAGAAILPAAHASPSRCQATGVAWPAAMVRTRTQSLSFVLRVGAPDCTRRCFLWQFHAMVIMLFLPRRQRLRLPLREHPANTFQLLWQRPCAHECARRDLLIRFAHRCQQIVQHRLQCSLPRSLRRCLPCRRVLQQQQQWSPAVLQQQQLWVLQQQQQLWVLQQQLWVLQQLWSPAVL